MTPQEKVDAVIELCLRQRVLHLELIGPDTPVLIEVDRVLEILL